MTTHKLSLRLALIIVSALALSLAACSGSSRTLVRAKAAPHYSDPGPQAAPPAAEAPAEESAYGDAEAYPAQPAPESGAVEQYRPYPPAQKRPGLATRWGERRHSSVQEVSFVRDSANTPFAAVTFHYDDEDGIEGATGRDEDDAYPGVVPVRGGALSVSLVEPDDDPLPLITARGRHYVIGDGGDRYVIRVDNHTPERFEVVASVDGLDVLDGSDAGFHQRGYLIEPWGTLRIEGFRESYSSVRAFRFGDVSESYAVRRGRGRNVGVVGVALFAERGHGRAYPNDAWQRDTADPFPSRFAPPPRLTL